MAIITLKNQHGTPENPLVIDGNWQILDGGQLQRPMVVENCTHFVVRRFGLHDSSGDVLRIRYCSDFVIEQMCLWNAASQNVAENSTNYNCLAIHESQRGKVFDCALWGTGRKTMCFSTEGNDIHVDRCWVRYDEPWNPDNDIHGGRPRMAVAVAYNNRRCIFTDCIAGCTQASGDKGFYRGVFSVDRMDDGSDPQTTLFRCLAQTPLDVEAFDTVGVPITLRECLDNTHEGLIDGDSLKWLTLRWSTSPILGRIQQLAGVDVLGQLDTLAHPTPITPPPPPPPAG